MNKNDFLLLDTFVNKEFMPYIIEAINDADELINVELKLKPTSYAGFRNEDIFDNYGGLKLRGFPVKNNKDHLKPNGWAAKMKEIIEENENL